MVDKIRQEAHDQIVKSIIFKERVGSWNLLSLSRKTKQP